MRERTYAPQLCLLQFATADEIVFVDALTLDDWSVLQPLLVGGPVKLLHSPGQDFEALATVGLNQLAPMFCTQMAHALLGGPPQIGYAGLVKERLEVELAKDQTRTDWSRRPLSEAQLGYAADDVRYLGELYRQLTDRLEEQGRSHWMAEEMAVLEQSWALPDPLALALKSRSLERLEPAEKCVFIALSQWREARARHSDKPRSWIAKDGFLSAVARRQPGTLEELERLEGCTPGLLRNQGEVLLKTIREAPANCPDIPEPIPRETSRELQQKLTAIAKAHGIEPGILASRADCEEWLRARAGRLASGWRAELAAAALS